ncbi:MAG: FeoA family protein [Sphingomonadaceae bacterium]
MTLDRLGIGAPARIKSVTWDLIAPEEAKRLRALGVDIDSELTISHRGIFGGADPIAITVGNMTIALRRSHARAIAVEAL